MRNGTVYLIGAGPGDPGLLTLKGRDILSKAEVVVYDALINPHILHWTRPGTLKIFVGKRSGIKSKSQEAINALLLRYARRGKAVARLKGGDPFLFARGGEEAAYLANHRIPFEVVPGVTSASGSAGYAGIPLTDRRLSSMVTFVTGHEVGDKNTVPVDWTKISPQGTLVIFMGLEELQSITDRLLRLGWNPQTPAAAVRWGSTPRQQVVEGSIVNIAAHVRRTHLLSPVLIIIGSVVTLRKKFHWVDQRPLYGKNIVITRPAEQAPDFTRLLEDLGANVISLPTIEIVPPKDWKGLDRAMEDIGRFDWILFTSVNGVSMFFSRLKELGRDIRDLKGARLGAIGPKTSARLEAFGLKVKAFPDEYRAEGLAKVLGDVKGNKILLARAEEARDILPEKLKAQGALVTIGIAYRTLKPRPFDRELRQQLLSRQMDAITFTSSSTVDGFMQHFTIGERRTIFSHTVAAVIGPITAKTLRGYGISPRIQAKHYTTDDLAQAIVKYFS